MSKNEETTRRNGIHLHPRVSLEPFEKWGMDFIGPIDPSSGKKKHILVCIDYITKWDEVRAMKDLHSSKNSYSQGLVI
jgi:hypothetical protein